MLSLRIIIQMLTIGPFILQVISQIHLIILFLDIVLQNLDCKLIDVFVVIC